MVGKIGMLNKKRYMKLLKNKLLILASVFLVGCASTNNYQLYIDAQKTLNKDYTMAELARIAALTEIVKETTDINVRIQAIRALQEIQRSKRPLQIETPKSTFGF